MRAKLLDPFYRQKLQKRINNFNQHVSCCEECHFELEEKYFHLLPKHIAEHLKEEHERLRKLKFPKELVKKHALEEMIFYEMYLPPNIVERFDADHVKLGVHD